MASTGLLGPFRLTFDQINDSIPRVAPGAYALGHTDPRGKFYVDYVGRADANVREKLHEFIGSATMFKYSCVPSAEAAFMKECELYHEFKPPGNRMHPDRPKGTSWECPRCRFFRLQQLT
jgi:hypothetical protein